MTKKINITCFLTLIISIFIDQFTKYLAQIHLKDNSITIIENVFSLTYLENKGVGFGFLQNKMPLILALNLIVLLFIFYFYYKLPKNKRFFIVHIVTVLVFSGAIGNIIDRVRLGYVIDFFYFELIDFPIFNVADIYVTLSVILFVILFLFVYTQQEFDALFSFKKEEKHMNLTKKNVCYELNTVEPVESLIKAAFPKEEQESMELLLNLSKKSMVNFWAYYDEDQFCGFIYVVESSETLFVLYLAVPGELRSKGYGAAIIEDVRRIFNGKDMVLHVENPNIDDKEKAEQRMRRIKFYERLGFKDTGYRLNAGFSEFWLISTEHDYRISTYMDLMNEYSDGEYTPKVYKA